MNKRDLRVGNLVEILTANKKINLPTGQFGTIEEIREEKVKIKLRNESSDVVHVFNRKYDTIRPIKLTHEWMLKLGFEEINGFRYKHWNLELSFYFDTNGDLESDYFPIFIFYKYVNEIQNLYYDLTGDEFKIKIQDEIHGK
jgi:hypothetical protein